MEAMRAAFPEEYPEFSPLAFSLDVFIPLFALHQEPFWTPASNKNDDLWKSSILLILLVATFAALVALKLFVRQCQEWIRRKRDNVSGLMWVGIGMIFLVCIFLALYAAGYVHICWDIAIAWLEDWRWLTVWYWVEIIAGWILTSMLLLSVTGLLRPSLSSGEKD